MASADNKLHNCDLTKRIYDTSHYTWRDKQCAACRSSSYLRHTVLKLRHGPAMRLVYMWNIRPMFKIHWWLKKVHTSLHFEVRFPTGPHMFLFSTAPRPALKPIPSPNLTGALFSGFSRPVCEALLTAIQGQGSEYVESCLYSPVRLHGVQYIEVHRQLPFATRFCYWPNFIIRTRCPFCTS